MADKNYDSCAAVRLGTLGLLFLSAVLASCSSTAIPPNATINPSSANVPVAQKQTFAISGSGNGPVAWAVNGVAGGNSTVGTITAAGPNGIDGIYSSPPIIPSPATVKITAMAGTNTSALGNATATIGPLVTVSPSTPLVATYGTQQFTATVAGTSNTAVSWQVNCPAGGSLCGVISQTGLYKAPNSVPTAPPPAGVDTRQAGGAAIVAVSQENPAFSGSGAVGIVSLNQQAQTTPIQLGTSGSNANASCIQNGVDVCSGGTLAALVNRAGSLYILSASHVLASGNSPVSGDRILQPSLLDSECGLNPTTVVANLSQFTDPVNTTTKVDAALAQVASGAVDGTGAILELGSTISNGIPQPGEPAQGAGNPAAVNEFVAKSGDATGLTCANVESVDTSIQVQLSRGCPPITSTVTFPDEVIVQGSQFSAGGDSGSLIVDANTAEPIGLLFAGNATDLTIANPVSDVLNALKDSSGNIPTFVGGAQHAVAACGLPEPSASTARAARASQTAVPQDAVENAYAVAQRRAGQLLADDSVGAVGVGASLDAPGEPAVVVFVKEEYAGILPASLDGIRTRIVRTSEVAGGGLLDRPQTEALLARSESQSGVILDAAAVERAKDIKEKHAVQLMIDPTVQGVGVGASLDSPGEIALILYVSRGQIHRPIPADIGGLRTRIRETSPFRASVVRSTSRYSCSVRAVEKVAGHQR